MPNGHCWVDKPRIQNLGEGLSKTALCFRLLQSLPYHVPGPASCPTCIAADNAYQDLNCRIHEVIDHAPRLPEGHELADGTENLEELNESYSTRSNWLRAAVLGANDGLVSVAAIMLGAPLVLLHTSALLPTA